VREAVIKILLETILINLIVFLEKNFSFSTIANSLKRLLTKDAVFMGGRWYNSLKYIEDIVLI